ncbi:MAG: hypothetical protein N2746_10125 [Deltaproteobacteria bacterium]|nr:hypothetical protein [Deltaproteobacteria bacterium]
MLKNYATQNRTTNDPKYYTFSPGRYLYLDRYLERLFQSERPFSFTISLFDGRVTLTLVIEEKRIMVRGDKQLSDEVVRHLFQFPLLRDFSIEVI